MGYAPLVHLPSELRLEMSEISFATESVLTLAGICKSLPPPEPVSPAPPPPPPPRRLSEGVATAWRCERRVAGDCVDGDLCRRIVEKRLTKEVLCLNLRGRG